MGPMRVNHVSRGIKDEWEVGKTKAQLRRMGSGQRAWEEASFETSESEEKVITEKPESVDKVHIVERGG